MLRDAARFLSGGFVSGNVEELPDPSPQRPFRPPAERQPALFPMNGLALVAQRMSLAGDFRAGAVCPDGRGHLDQTLHVQRFNGFVKNRTNSQDGRLFGQRLKHPRQLPCPCGNGIPVPEIAGW